MSVNDPDPDPADEAPGGEEHNELRYRDVDEDADHDEAPGGQGPGSEDAPPDES